MSGRARIGSIPVNHSTHSFPHQPPTIKPLLQCGTIDNQVRFIMKVFLWCVITIVLAGCAIIETTMVAPNGQKITCKASGAGLSGMGQAYESRRRCVEALASNGWHDASQPNKSPAQLLKDIEAERGPTDNLRGE